MALILLLLYVSRVAGQWLFIEEGMPESLLTTEPLIGVQIEQVLYELYRNFANAWTLLSQVVCDLLLVRLLGTHIC